MAVQVLDHLPPGVDVTLIEESLKLTPTERIERMVELLKTMEALQQAGRAARAAR